MTTLLITTTILLGLFLFGTVGQIAAMSRDLADRDWQIAKLQDELDDANDELSELRREYERATGGVTYRSRPVNRVFGSKPR